jgi:hypothetical protein
LRFRLLILLCLYIGLVEAEWTGVGIDISNFDSDWKFDSGVREARITSLSFQIEEKFEPGLIAGGGIGYFDMRVRGDSSVDTQEFNGQFLDLYLRQPFPVSESIALHGRLGFRYYSGDDRSGTDRADISWSETNLQVGVGVRFSHFRITPFVAYYNIDGDISDDIDTGDFENDDSISQGVSFDYFVDDSAYIRVEVRSGYQEGGYLSFARRY